MGERGELSMKARRRLMFRMMLLHTCVGHPVAQLCLWLGSQRFADKIHYATLPRRARRKLGAAPTFNPDPRLRTLDCLTTPACSVLRAFGAYRLAETVFLLHPRWTDAILCGACGYILHRTPDGGYERGWQREARLEKERLAKIKREATAKLISLDFTQVFIEGSSWFWKSPGGRAVSDGEAKLISLTGHELLDFSEEVERAK